MSPPIPAAATPPRPAECPARAAAPEIGAERAFSPNAWVRWAFYLSVFSIPFSNVYLPGTGEHLGVLRLVQLLVLVGVLTQPRVCLRLVPTATFWFLAYAVLRIGWGLWLTPEWSAVWWPSSREYVEFLLPCWLWIMFNVLQFRGVRRPGLWALALGCSLCALFHLAGIGVVEVPDEPGHRSSVFGLNANELGATYAVAMVVLLGLWLFRSRTPSERWAPFPLIALVGIALAITGSRTAILVLGLGVVVLFFWGKSSGLRRWASLLLLGAVLAVTLWKIPTILDRFQELNPHDLGRLNPRARMAPVLWEMFLRSPIYGLGPDGYQFELTRRAMPYLIRQQKTIASHNLVLLLLVETGLIGFFLFSMGLKEPLAAAWRARFSLCGPLPLAMLLPLVIGGATVCNPSHHLVFWVAMAYALAGVA